MMKKLAVSLTAATLFSGVAVADEYEKQIDARKAQMTIIAYNMGILGKMAKGQMDYDAATASAAAGNLSMAASMDQMGLWPAGSSEDEADDTKAKMAIWKDMNDFDNLFMGLKTASVSLADAAGNGLPALRGAIGDVGKTCKGCHSDYKSK